MFAVAGVSGHTGSVVASMLLDAGHRVRVVVRDAAKGERWRARGTQVAVADLRDAEALARALSGVDGAYLLIPPDLSAADPLARGRLVAESLAQAVEHARVPHVVFLSSMGAQHAEGTGPIRQLHHAEELLARLPPTRFTFLRAAYFLENLASTFHPAKARGLVPSLIPPAKKIPMVATNDIGRTAAHALLAPPPANEVIELAGPADYSFADVAHVLARVLGKPLRVVHVPDEDIVPALTGAGLPAPFAELYRELARGLESGLVAWDGKGRRVRGDLGLEAFLRGLLGVQRFDPRGEPLEVEAVH